MPEPPRADLIPGGWNDTPPETFEVDAPPEETRDQSRQFRDAFTVACADPEYVEFTVKGRTGPPVTMRYPLNEFEVGQAQFASEIEPEIVEVNSLMYSAPIPRATGCRYGKVGMALVWRPRFPEDPAKSRAWENGA
jgi:hypothetical protein